MKRTVILVFAILVVGLQLVPVDRSNPPVSNDLPAPAAVKEILVRSCYDCHSNTTRWPWYARVAPVSWLVAGHVRDGRAALNFSHWLRYDHREQQRLGAAVIETMEKRTMPLPAYIYLHPEAKLTGSEIRILRSWRP